MDARLVSYLSARAANGAGASARGIAEGAGKAGASSKDRARDEDEWSDDSVQDSAPVDAPAPPHPKARGQGPSAIHVAAGASIAPINPAGATAGSVAAGHQPSRSPKLSGRAAGSTKTRPDAGAGDDASLLSDISNVSAADNHHDNRHGGAGQRYGGQGGAYGGPAYGAEGAYGGGGGASGQNEKKPPKVPHKPVDGPGHPPPQPQPIPGSHSHNTGTGTGASGGTGASRSSSQIWRKLKPIPLAPYVPIPT